MKLARKRSRLISLVDWIMHHKADYAKTKTVKLNLVPVVICWKYVPWNELTEKKAINIFWLKSRWEKLNLPERKST